MWIRSQDKRILIDVRGVGTFEGADSTGTLYTLDTDSEYILGEYKTLKRAIEVLDEIQKALLDNLSFGMTSNNKIYQMPEK